VTDWWTIERELLDGGMGPVCGVDEAGRGPLAGPVCAAAVILPPGLMIEGLDDSKKLTARKREQLYDVIVASALTYGIAMVSERVIDEINILNATYRAMNEAIAKLDPAPAIALIDGNRSDGIVLENRTVIGGDGLSASIAAASVLAKVTRDRLMESLGKEYPGYGFERHKGYGTKAHYAALTALGPSPLHRRTFLKKLI
jgi:ribonuclease HII